jgi:hypothetical protein
MNAAALKHPEVDAMTVLLEDVVRRASARYASELEKVRHEIEDFSERLEKLEAREHSKALTADDVLPALKADLQALVKNLPLPADGEDGKDGKDGTSVTLADIEPLIESRTSGWALDFERRAQGVLQSAIERMPEAKDGKDAEPVKPEQIAKAVSDYLLVHPIPVPKDGKDGTDGESVSVYDVMPVLEERLNKAIAAIRIPNDGVDGKSVTVDDVMPKLLAELDALVQEAVDAIPRPKDGRDGIDGKSVTAEDVLPELEARLQKAIDALPVPQNGKDGTSVTLEDMVPILESYAASWALDFEKRAHDVLQRTIDRMPKAKDGRDALQLEDFQCSLNGRMLTLALVRGSVRVERVLKLDIPLYREIWKDSESYDKGDCVTYDGALWIALKDNTKSRPGEFSTKAWRLAVKKGRNGKGSP